MGLLSGRSRHTSRKKPSNHNTDKSSYRRERRVDEEPVEDAPPKPDLDELRRHRTEYYSVPPAARRRVASSGTVNSVSKRSTVSSVRTTGEKRRGTQKRRHKSSPAKVESRGDDGQRTTEDYVYGPRVAQTPDVRREKSPRVDAESSRPTRKPSSNSTSSRRRSLPTVFEAEITPDDSISQVGVNTLAEQEERPLSSRPSIRRSKTTSSKLPAVPEAHEATSSISRSKKPARAPSLLSAFSRRHSTTSVPTPPRLIECLTCGSDDIPTTKSARLNCGHRMCHECLKRIFTMSVKDPQHMPPKCCGPEHIDLKHVAKLFDDKFKVLWNRKYQEYHTKNRIYCPTLKCGEWIKPSHIHTSQGRKYAQCPRCKTKVCTLCNNKMHKSSDCPEDPEIAKLVEQAKEKGWQRCYSCNALVERKEGCNHMTCRCLAEFCIVCGSKWKTCECPWFNYANLPNPDHLGEMRVPEPIQIIYRQFFDANHPPPPPPPVPAAVPLAAAGINDNPRPRARPDPRSRPAEPTYQQELDQRRRQERLDEDLARRLQLASLMNPDEDPQGPQGNPRNRAPEVEVWGVGNAAGNFMGDNFVQNATNVLMGTFGDAAVGRRGERTSARRRRSGLNDGRDPGLAADFLGDDSVLGVGMGAGAGRRGGR